MYVVHVKSGFSLDTLHQKPAAFITDYFPRALSNCLRKRLA